jgi:hypothetical protein
VPLWLTVAELDPGWIAQQAYRTGARPDARQWPRPTHFFRGHNHVSTVQSLGSPHEIAATNCYASCAM